MGEYMYKVIFAMEEEEKIRIQKILQEDFSQSWKFIDIKNEEEIHQKIKSDNIDILFLSLSYDNFSGLRVLSKIRKINKSIHICVCSSYFSSDMVTEVVMFDVDAYLSMPTKKVQVVQSITKILDKIEEEKIEWINKKGQENYLRQTKNILEYGFLYTILFGKKSEKYLHEYCDALGMMYKGYMISVMPIGEVPKEDDFEERLQYEIKKVIKKYEKSVVSSKIFERYVIFCSWGREEMPERHKDSYFLKLEKELIKNVKEKLGIVMNVGIGNVYPIKDVYLSYQQSTNVIFFKEKDKRSVFQREEGLLTRSEYADSLSQLLEQVKFGKSEALDTFNEILLYLESLEYEAKINKIFQILILCCHLATTEGENELEFFNYMEFFRELENVKDVEAWAYKKFEYIMKVIVESNNAGKPGAIRSAIDYIGTHYTEDISLQDVARHVGLTPQHFSKMFKSYTGKNYVEWISHLRIERAIQYLNTGNKSMKEIGYLVGYRDPNYFSRIFKKIEGITPSEYVNGVR